MQVSAIMNDPMYWKTTFLAIFCLLFVKLNHAQILSSKTTYANPKCNTDTEITFTVLNNGNPASDLMIKIEIINNFQVTNLGDFMQSGPQPTEFSTAIFGIPSEVEISKRIWGFRTTYAPASIPVYLLLGGIVIQQLTLDISPFSYIPSSPNPVLLSHILTQPNSPLLPPAQAAMEAQQVHIDGTLVVDLDYTFFTELTEQGEITMGPDAKIVVKNGVNLNLFGTHIYGCDAMWKGIELQAGSQLNAIRAHIEHAEEAIYLKSNSDPNDPTEVLVRRTRFEKNKVGIFSEDLPTGQHAINLSIIGSSFEGGESYSEAGLYLQDMPHVPITGEGQGFVFYFTRFSGFETGIWAQNSDITYQAPWVKDNETGIHVEELSTLTVLGSSVASVFEDNKKCIFALNSDLEVSKCEFLNASFGIDFASILGHTLLVEENYMETLLYGVKVFAKNNSSGQILNNDIRKINGGSGFCLFMTGDNINPLGNWEVKDNELYLMSGGVATALFLNMNNLRFTQNFLFNNDPRVAIYLAGGYKNEISCNNVLGASNGLIQFSSEQSEITCNEFNVTNTAYRVRGWCEYTAIMGNHLDGDIHDLAYGYSWNPIAITGDQPYYFLAPQHGNFFHGSGSVQAIHYGSASEVDMSQYLVFDYANPDYMPSVSAATNSWFLPILPYNGIFSCANANCTTPYSSYPVEPMAVDYTIKNNQLTSGNFATEMQWTGHQHLYRRLAKQQRIHQDFQAYFATLAITDVGQLHRTQRELNDAMAFDVAEQAQLDHLYAAKSNAMDALHAYVAKNNYPDTDSLQAYSTILYEINHDLRGIWEYKNAQLPSQLPQISTQHAAILSQSTPGQNEKAVNEIQLSLLNNGSLRLNASQISQLESIAETCPEAGGDAVLRARAYLALTDSLYTWDDSTACTQNGRARRWAQETAQDVQLSIFPNPASDVVICTWEEEREVAAWFRVKSMDGKIKYEKLLAAEEKQLSISVKDWPTAIYILSVELPGREPQQKKLVIKHQ